MPAFKDQISGATTLRPWLILLTATALSSRLAASQTVPSLISQVHIAQTSSPSAMTIMWASTDAAKGSDVLVKQTLDGVETHMTGVSTSYVYNKTYFSPLLHTAVLTGLAPRTTYFYRCGDLGSMQFSKLFNFTTMPAKGDGSKVMTFGVIADLGMTADSKATLQHIVNNPALHMVLLAGDLSYANGVPNIWDDYGAMIQEMASSRPYMVGAGNHEVEYLPSMGMNGSTLFQAYESRFKMSDKPAQRGEIEIMSSGYKGCCPSAFLTKYDYGSSFYSFDAGLTHIIYANPYTSSDVGSEQYKWLTQDLASVDRAVTPWIFVVMHCPWYNSNTAHQNEFSTTMMRNHLETLFYEHNVNAVVSGHVHAYERSHPAYKNLTDAKGIVYFNIGDGGNAEGHAYHYDNPAPVWSAFRNGTQYGHAELQILSATEARWTWYRNIDGEYINKDSYTLVNTANVVVTGAPTPAPTASSTNILTVFAKATKGLSNGEIVGIAVAAGFSLLAVGALFNHIMCSRSSSGGGFDSKDVDAMDSKSTTGLMGAGRGGSSGGLAAQDELVVDSIPRASGSGGGRLSVSSDGPSVPLPSSLPISTSTSIADIHVV